MANDIQIPAPFNTWYTIREAAIAMEYKHSQYVRKLLHDNKLGEYVTVATDEGGTPQLTPDGAYIVESGSKIKLLVGKTEQWRIDPAACQAYKERAAAGGGTFGQHAVRRMTLRFSTTHFTIEEIQTLLEEGLGDRQEGEGEGSFRWELAKAWKGGSKKTSKTAKPGETVVASIVTSLTSAEVDDDEDFGDDVEDEDDDLDDVLA